MDLLRAPLQVVSGIIRLDELIDQLAAIHQEVMGMRGDVQRVGERVDGLRADVQSMAGGVVGIQAATESLEGRVDSVTAGITAVDVHLGNLNTSLKSVDALASRLGRFGGRRSRREGEPEAQTPEA